MKQTRQTLVTLAMARNILIACALIIGGWIARPARAQSYNWVGDPGSNGHGNWSSAGDWSPNGIPNGAAQDATISANLSNPNDLNNGPTLDITVSVHNLSLINPAVLSDTGASPRNITVLGTTTITTTAGHGGQTGIISSNGGTFTLGQLGIYDSTTKTLGSGGINVSNGGAIQWQGADVVTNQSFLYVNGPTSRVLNQNGGASALTHLAINAGTVQFVNGFNFTTQGAFTNNLLLAVGLGGDTHPTTFTINGQLTNFDSGTKTLNGGLYTVDGSGQTATLRFASADIRLLNGASLYLYGDAHITDLGGVDGLRNLSGIQNRNLRNTGTQTINPGGNHSTFTNDASTHSIHDGSSITVDGGHHSINNGATNIGPPTSNSNTTLTITGSSLIESGGLDMGGEPGVNTQYHTQLQVMNGLEFRGAYLTGTGTTFADVGTIQFNQSSILDPGHSPGELTFAGNAALAMDGTTTTRIQIGGYTAGEEFDRIIKTGGSMTLGGKLLLEMYNGFENEIDNSDLFDVISASTNLFGSFSNIVSGNRVATNDGKGTFIVTYAGSQSVRLSAFLPPPRAVDVTKTPGNPFTIYFRGYPNSSYDLVASTDLVNYQTIGSLGTGAGGDYDVFATVDPNAGSYTKRFYRVVYPMQAEEVIQQLRPRKPLGSNKSG